MMPERKSFRALVALLAVFSQLWLGAAHAAMAGSGGYCGDGTPQRAQRLLEQLPPELRMPIDVPDGSQQNDCKLCAPLCSPALPSAKASLPAVPKTVPRLLPRVVVCAYDNGATCRPPATGPPLVHV